MAFRFAPLPSAAFVPGHGRGPGSAVPEALATNQITRARNAELARASLAQEEQSRRALMESQRSAEERELHNRTQLEWDQKNAAESAMRAAIAAGMPLTGNPMTRPTGEAIMRSAGLDFRAPKPAQPVELPPLGPGMPFASRPARPAPPPTPAVPGAITRDGEDVAAYDPEAASNELLNTTVATFQALAGGAAGVDKAASAQALAMAPHALKLHGNDGVKAAEWLAKGHKARLDREHADRRAARMSMADKESGGSFELREAGLHLKRFDKAMVSSGATEIRDHYLALDTSIKEVRQNPKSPAAWAKLERAIAKSREEGGRLSNEDVRAVSAKEYRSVLENMRQWADAKFSGEISSTILNDVLRTVEIARDGAKEDLVRLHDKTWATVQSLNPDNPDSTNPNQLAYNWAVEQYQSSFTGVRWLPLETGGARRRAPSARDGGQRSSSATVVGEEAVPAVKAKVKSMKDAFNAAK